MADDGWSHNVNFEGRHFWRHRDGRKTYENPQWDMSGGGNPMLAQQSVTPPPAPIEVVAEPEVPAGPPPFQHPEGNYTGDTVEDNAGVEVAHGQGTLVTAQSTYKGAFDNNQRSGPGVESFLDGRELGGTFENNTLSYGTIRSGAMVYEGEVANNHSHGAGKLDVNNAIQLTYEECTWEGGQPTAGKMKCSTGSYEGTFRGAAASPFPFAPAEGVFSSKNGFIPWAEINGTFDLAAGRFQGSIKFNDGSDYAGGASLTYNQGQLFALQKVGVGKYTTLTQMMEGTFDAAGFFKGKCTYSNNDVYEGEMQGGLKHGMGRLVNHQGFVDGDGKWRNDVKVDEFDGGCCTLQ